MKARLLVALLLTFGLIYTFGAGVAWADGAKGVSIQPLTPKPGDVINVKGDLLGANSTVEVRIIGTSVDIDLGEVPADAGGDFSAQFRIPADLQPGNYQVQAKGAESATAEITVIGAGASEAGGMPEPAPVLRERPFGESLILVALFGLLAAAGIFFARTAHEKPAGEATSR